MVYLNWWRLLSDAITRLSRFLLLWGFFLICLILLQTFIIRTISFSNCVFNLPLLWTTDKNRMCIMYEKWKAYVFPNILVKSNCLPPSPFPLLLLVLAVPPFFLLIFFSLAEVGVFTAFLFPREALGVMASSELSPLWRSEREGPEWEVWERKLLIKCSLFHPLCWGLLHEARLSA